MKEFEIRLKACRKDLVGAVEAACSRLRAPETSIRNTGAVNDLDLADFGPTLRHVSDVT